MSNGTSLRLARTAAIERGRSKGRLPSGDASPKSTSSNAFSPMIAAAAVPSGPSTAGRSKYRSIIVGTVAEIRYDSLEVVRLELERAPVEEVDKPSMARWLPGRFQAKDSDLGLGWIADHGGIAGKDLIRHALRVDRDSPSKRKRGRAGAGRLVRQQGERHLLRTQTSGSEVWAAENDSGGVLVDERSIEQAKRELLPEDPSGRLVDTGFANPARLDKLDQPISAAFATELVDTGIEQLQ